MNRSLVQNKSTYESLSTTQRQPLYSSKEKLKSHLQRIKITEPTSLVIAIINTIKTLLKDAQETPAVHFSVISPLKICHQLQECPSSQVKCKLKLLLFAPYVTIPDLNYNHSKLRNGRFLNVRSHFTN